MSCGEYDVCIERADLVDGVTQSCEFIMSMSEDVVDKSVNRAGKVITVIGKRGRRLQGDWRGHRMHECLAWRRMRGRVARVHT